MNRRNTFWSGPAECRAIPHSKTLRVYRGHWKTRQVLDCASPLALWQRAEEGRWANHQLQHALGRKRQRTGRAQRRRRFSPSFCNGRQSQSGVALCLPPQSKVSQLAARFMESFHGQLRARNGGHELMVHDASGSLKAPASPAPSKRFAPFRSRSPGHGASSRSRARNISNIHIPRAPVPPGGRARRACSRVLPRPLTHARCSSSSGATALSTSISQINSQSQPKSSSEERGLPGVGANEAVRFLSPFAGFVDDRFLQFQQFLDRLFRGFSLSLLHVGRSVVMKPPSVKPLAQRGNLDPVNP